MKRFELKEHKGEFRDDDYSEMIESSEGEWVKFSDVEYLTAAISAHDAPFNEKNFRTQKILLANRELEIKYLKDLLREQVKNV